MKLKPYPEYKDSGVAWLGKVPKHWEMRKLKYLSKINPSIKTIDNASTRVSFVPMERTRQNYPFFYPENREYQEVRTGFTCFQDNDVLIAKITPCFENGKGGICRNLVNGIGFGSTEFHVIRTDSALEKVFFYYLTISKSFRNYGTENMQGSAGQKRVPTDFIKNLLLAFPSISEQLAIARFLDYKTAQIARFIKAKKRMIELLKEQKQVIINDAVTGKIVIKDEGGRLKAEKRPDSSFILHPSSFLQKVPEGWEVRKLRVLLKPKAIKNRPDLKLLSVVREKGIIVRDITDFEENHNFIPDDLNNYKVVNVGEFAMNKMKAWQGSYGISNHHGIVSPAYFVFDVNFENKVFFNYAIRTRFYVNYFGQASDGVRIGQWDLSLQRMKEIPFIIPPVEVQNSIVNDIPKFLKNIDLAISRTEREIVLMQEYRTRLISDVVTGKIDVRDIEIPDIADIDVTLDESTEEPEGEEELEPAEGDE